MFFVPHYVICFIL